MWVNKRVSLHDNDVDVITILIKLNFNEQLFFHDNHVLHVYFI